MIEVAADDRPRQIVALQHGGYGFLDQSHGQIVVAEQFDQPAAVALGRRHSGMAIGIGHPHDETLDALQRWLRELSSKGMQLVSVSAIVRERGAPG